MDDSAVELRAPRWACLDPRRRLAAAIGWTVGLLVAGSALVAAQWSADAAEARVRADGERLLAQFAGQMGQSLANSLETRRATLRATAAHIVAGDLDAHATADDLLALQRQFPELRWVGVADGSGRVLASVGTGGPATGASAADQPWFERGIPRYVVSLAAQDRAVASAMLAMPLVRHHGADTGVLAARLDWGWVQARQQKLLATLDSPPQLEWLLLTRELRVIDGPPRWRGRQIAHLDELDEQDRYLVGVRDVPAAPTGHLGLRVAVREPADAALATARQTHRSVLLAVLLAGLGAALASVWVTRRLLRRLGLLADEARAVASGSAAALTPPPGADEVAGIGRALSRLVAQLQAEKAALAALNAELDARVAERTAHLERMADEAHEAAVVRERLHLARALHDTLAHSLMALLTQIRMVRKLGGTLDAAQLDEELAQAEAVASGGLADVRATIQQMRVREAEGVGLAAALRELTQRFSQRSGIPVALHAQAAGQRAEACAPTLLRMAEEALRNIERHAQAGQVVVTLDSPEAGQTRLVVQDDGVGFDVHAACPGHWGLAGLREQAALIGAALALPSAAGAGTRLTVTWPDAALPAA